MFANFFKTVRNKTVQATSIGTTTTTVKYPFYIKATLVLLGLYLSFNILLLLKDTLVPICFATLIAILLNPLVNKLVSVKVPKVLAISIAILLAMLLVAGIIIFISSQLASFSEFAPQFKQRGNQIMNDVFGWVTKTFNVPREKQMTMLNDAAKSGQVYIGETLSTLAGIIGVVVLLPIYAFLILYYKPLFLNFFYEVFESVHENKVTDVLNETKSAVQSYILGLLIETAIIAALNSTALLILGVKYGILLGVIGAILNLIPYLGGLVAIILPVLMSIITGDGGFTTPLLIIGAYMIIQFLDNNLIVPQVVSSKVEVNAFVSIIIVLLGGELWGLSGMFLSIPFIAICKIIFDRIDHLKPWGKILGTAMNDRFTLKKVAVVQEDTLPQQDNTQSDQPLEQ